MGFALGSHKPDNISGNYFLSNVTHPLALSFFYKILFSRFNWNTIIYFFFKYSKMLYTRIMTRGCVILRGSWYNTPQKNRENGPLEFFSFVNLVLLSSLNIIVIKLCKIYAHKSNIEIWNIRILSKLHLLLLI